MESGSLSQLRKNIDRAFILTYQSLEESRKLIELCLDEAERLEYGSGIIQSRILLSLLEVYRGNRDLARDKLNRLEEELGVSISDECLMSLSYVRGVYFLRESVYSDAFDAFVKTGNLASRLGDNLFQVLSSNGKGIIKFDQMEYQDAYDYFRVSRTYLKELSSEILPVLLSLNMGCALGGMERNSEALTLLDETLEKAEKEGLQILECSILDEIGMILKKEKRLDEAEVFFRKGLERSRGMDYEDTVTELFYNYAGLLMERGDYETAESVLRDHGRSSEDDSQLTLYNKAAAEVYERKGEAHKALECYKEILASYENALDGKAVQSVLHQEKRLLQEENHRLRLVSTIGQELVATLDLGQILNLIYAQLNALMPVDFLAVATVDGNTIDVKFSLNRGAVVKPFTIHKENPDSVLAWAVRNRKEVFLRDALRDAEEYVRTVTLLDGQEENLSKSIICIPLIHLDEVVGVLSVQSSELNAYSSQDMDTLRAMGSYTAIALKNAMQTEKLNELNEMLREQSSTDSLTGLVNRRAFLEQAGSIWRVCRRNKFWFTLIMIDLDHFKIINDTHGHMAGDKVLSKMGSLLNYYFKRALDCASRYGGEELLILVGDMAPEEAAVRVELLREAFSSFCFSSPKGEFTVNFSCGIYGELPDKAVETRLSRITGIVDRCLYKAKEGGRNCTFLRNKGQKTAKKFIPGKS